MELLDEIAIARAIHVLAVVIWIGGVGMVTTVLLPSVRKLARPAARVALFDAIESRFAWQSRVTTLLAGGSGFYMVWRLDLWDRFRFLEFWWMHAMVAVWAIFTLMLFVLEPLVLHRWFLARAKTHPDSIYKLIERLHWLLLILSAAAILGAVAGSHGFLWFL